MYKLLYTKFTKVIIDYLISHNKSIPHRPDSKLHSSQDDHAITKLLSTTNGDYKFGMEVLDAMISDAIKKKARYKYYMAKKVESEKDKIVNEPKEQHVSPIKSGRGKGFTCYGGQVANVPNKLKKNVMPRKARTALSTTFKYSRTALSTTSKESIDNWSAKLTKPLQICTMSGDRNSKMVTSSLLDFIQTLLDETPENKLMNFMSHPVYTNAQTTSVVHNPKGNPELTSYISGASEVSLEAGSTHKNFNVSKAFEKAVQTKVLTKIKKLLPTHIPDAIANYVKPHLNASVLEVMKTNQINLFTQSSTSTDDLSDMDQKLKLLNQSHLKKSNETHTTHQQLYDTLYESITLDQDALDAQAAQSSFHKRSHDNQDPPNNPEGENKKKHDINKDENHILGPSTVSIAKKFKELIKKDELTIADLEGAGLEWLKVQYNNDVELEYHVSQLKAAVLISAQKRSILLLSASIMLRDTTNKEEDRIDFFKAGMSAVTEGNIYSDLRLKLVVHIVVKKKWGYGFLTSVVVRRSDYKEYKFSYADLPRLSVNDIEHMYFLQVQDKLHHLPLEFVKDFNNALLMFIRRTMIKNRVEDIQLGVESYKKTLNLTKPTMFFEGIDQRIPFTMTATHKGSTSWVDPNKKGHSGKNLNRLWMSRAQKRCRRRLTRIHRHKEQIRRLEEYVGGRPKTINPRTFVRPL
ncbi:hypothetical protein Tco_0635694 [Tanacetum coccineum]